MIQELLTYPQVDQLRAGEVAEFHLLEDGTIHFIKILPIDQFLDVWDYSIADSQGEFDELETEIDHAKRYFGIVHEDGASLGACLKAVRQ